MAEPWTTGNNYVLKINARGNTSEQIFTSPISATQVKEAARSKGLSQFMVYDNAGNLLEPTAFPYSGDIVVREYNAAKTA